MRPLTDNAEFRSLVDAGDGYIYNDYSGHGAKGIQYNILHRASCGTLRQQSARVTGYYGKYFAESLDQAARWLEANRPRNWKRCGMCLRGVGPGTASATSAPSLEARLRPAVGSAPLAPAAIDLDWFKRYILAYNSYEPYPRTDFMIGAAFDRPPTLEVVKQRSRLIDGEWHAGLRYHTPGPDQVAERMFERAKSIVIGSWQPPRADLRALDLYASADVQLLLKPVELVLEAIGVNVISFTSKYLHWTYRSIFPPHDSQVLRSATLVLGRGVSDQAPWREAFLHVLRANQAAWKKLTDAQMGELLEFDYETQPAAHKRRLFPLRVLDKALWMAGRP
jgi:hypothetical protein